MNALSIFEKTEEGYVPKLDSGLRILTVGRSGSGKSTAEISFPGPIYVFDMDNRFKGTSAAINWLGSEKFSQIEFDYYNPRDGFEAIDTKLTTIFTDTEKKTPKYKTIIFDSVGSLVYTLALDSQRLRGVANEKGKIRGKLKFLHPDDYQYVSTAFRIITFNYLMPLNEMGINTLLSAWIVDKWAKRPGANEYAPSEVIGERIVGPGNLVEEVIGYFDEVYYFRKEPAIIEGKDPKMTVEFNGSFAKTAIGLPPGKFDITRKNFYTFWSEKVQEKK